MRRIWLTSIVTISFSSVLTPVASIAVQVPTVTEFKVINCHPNNYGPCGESDFQGTSALVEVWKPAAPRDVSQNVGRFYGIHCGAGNKTSGFRDCRWEADSHGPRMFCRFVREYSDDWELRPECNMPPATWSWSGHAGADVGGECAVFGTGSNFVRGPLNTPWGMLDPKQVANSGSAHCVKAADPIIPCLIGQIAAMDHGEQMGSGKHTITADIPVDCGTKPVIDIVNGPDLVLGPGVNTQISAAMVSQGVLRVESRLTTSLATPGSYSGSKILVLSPN